MDKTCNNCANMGQPICKACVSVFYNTNKSLLYWKPFPDTEADQAVKADAGKPRLSLVPLSGLIPLARVREFAEKKYGKDGIEQWRDIDRDRLVSALLRHIEADQESPDARDQSGLPHSYHMAMNAYFIAIRDMERLEAEHETD